jgi:hypothetical protein
MGKPASAQSQSGAGADSANPQDPATQWWGAMQQQFGQMMQAAQASGQAMTENKPADNTGTQSSTER